MTDHSQQPNEAEPHRYKGKGKNVRDVGDLSVDECRALAAWHSAESDKLMSLSSEHDRQAKALMVVIEDKTTEEG